MHRPSASISDYRFVRCFIPVLHDVTAFLLCKEVVHDHKRTSLTAAAAYLHGSPFLGWLNCPDNALASSIRSSSSVVRHDQPHDSCSKSHPAYVRIHEATQLPSNLTGRQSHAESTYETFMSLTISSVNKKKESSSTMSCSTNVLDKASTLSAGTPASRNRDRMHSITAAAEQIKKVQRK